MQLNKQPKPVRPLWALYGPSGDGKTVAAASLSAKFQIRPAAERNSVIELDDVLFIQLDRHGIQSLKAMGMEPVYIDASAQPENVAMWIQGMEGVLTQVREYLAAHPECKYVVVDAVSTAWDYLAGQFLSMNTTKDNRQAYVKAGAAFKAFILKLQALQAAQLWLCHSKLAFVDEDAPDADKQEAKRKAMRPGEYVVDLNLSPAMADFVRPKMDFIFALKRTLTATTDKRVIMTKPGGDFYLKNRFGDLLLPEEPADLGALMKKVEDSLAKMKQAE